MRHEGQPHWIAVQRDPETGRTVVAPPVISTSLPITLVRFEQWWEVLHDGVTFYIPTKLDQGFVESEEGSVGWKRSKEMIFVHNRTMAKTSGVVKFALRLADERGTEIPVELESEPNAFDLKGKRAVIPVVQAHVTQVDQTSLHDLFSEWKPGTFGKTFRDLSVATRDLKSLGAEHIRNRLDKDDAATVQKNLDETCAMGSNIVLEAFGLKLSAAQLTRWGILGLLCIELYFFVHLKQLSNKLHQDDAGWDTPWVGMYSAPLPRIIYFISIVLPVIAVGLLAADRCANLVSISGMPWTWRPAPGGNW